MRTDLFGRNIKFIPGKCERALVGGVAGIVIVFEQDYEKVIVLASLCFLYRQNLGGRWMDLSTKRLTLPQVGHV